MPFVEFGTKFQFQISVATDLIFIIAIQELFAGLYPPLFWTTSVFLCWNGDLSAKWRDRFGKDTARCRECACADPPALAISSNTLVKLNGGKYWHSHATLTHTQLQPALASGSFPAPCSSKKPFQKPSFQVTLGVRLIVCRLFVLCLDAAWLITSCQTIFTARRVIDTRVTPAGLWWHASVQIDGRHRASPARFSSERQQGHCATAEGPLRAREWLAG